MQMNGLFILRILITAYVLILIPIYYKNYGFKNFLWFSDIGLFLTFLAIWLKSSLLISIVVIGILPLEFIWNIDFWLHLFTGYNLCSLSAYMFESKYSYRLRALSLFHIFMPIIWIWCLIKWGYNINALFYWFFLSSVILLFSYFFATPFNNLNWVLVPRKYHLKGISQLNWLAILFIVISLISLLMHLFLKFINESGSIFYFNKNCISFF